MPGTILGMDSVVGKTESLAIVGRVQSSKGGTELRREKQRCKQS